ncbi:MAG: cysteine desulfurase [Saprospiraceae bacterium]|nr:cysteine desulfurase [Saprospiraceae bacterium]
MRIYLDNAATTPMLPPVIDAMAKLMQEQYGNPSSIHAEGRAMRAVIEEARKTVAKLIGAGIGEVFFTSGGTESSNMALKCAVRDLAFNASSARLPSTTACCTPSRLAHQGVKVEMLNVDAQGRIDYEQLESLLQDDGNARTLVSLMHGNNEIGTMTDMQRISQLCESYDAFYHSDTVQTMGHFPVDVSKTKIHFLTGGAHKFHGPKGVGFIYINHMAMLKPYIDGGGQERNMRGGTENAYGIVGLAKALELACANMEEHRLHITELRSYFKARLMDSFEDIQFNGAQKEGDFLYTVLSVSFPPSEKSELLLLHLDIAGVSASGGSACSSGAEAAGSHVLTAINAELGRKTIRFSFSHLNTMEEMDAVVEKLKGVVEQRKLETVGMY